mmetsp:Transcript_1984/g.4472  ORF Transcript_1984/g.4472 Transcript_1984/m.4472 type:complete len:374 (+) Transcript_1984:563-1684(+)
MDGDSATEKAQPGATGATAARFHDETVGDEDGKDHEGIKAPRMPGFDLDDRVPTSNVPSNLRYDEDLDAELAAADLQFEHVKDESSGSDQSSSETETWISWYCSLRGNEFLCEVDPDYIDDRFNMYGLPEMKFMNEAMDLIMDLDEEWEDEYDPDGPEREIIEANAETLYGIIHARFILTAHGLSVMHEKFSRREFGECLRIDCERQALLPIGLSDVLCEATVKVFCPRCREIYLPAKERQRGLDGAFWGRSFPHLFLMVYPQRIMDEPFDKYVPRIFGFRIHESSEYWRGCKRTSGSTETVLDRPKLALENADDAAEADGTDVEAGDSVADASIGQSKVPVNPPEPPSTHTRSPAEGKVKESSPLESPPADP